MKVDGIITEVIKYYTNLSVDSIYGYRKVTLLELPSGVEVEIDATSSVDLTISRQVMQHSAESKKVYMDGAKLNPNKMSIRGHIDITKLGDLQRLAREDISVYVSLTKDMGGAHLSMGHGEYPGFSASLADGVNESDTLPYVIQSLNINDSGFKNTVEISIELIEVVMFEKDYRSTYKYSVKPSKGVQIAGTQNTEIPAKAIKIDYEKGEEV